MSSKTTRPIQMAKNLADPKTETASLQFSLPQMLDLALGTPEVGAVNMNILHNFLHVLLHQVNLRTTKVEYRGEDASRLQKVAMTARTGPSLHLHEYNIIESSGKVKQRIHSTEDVTVKVDVYTEEAKTTQGKTSKGGKPPASAPASARGKGIKEQGSEGSLEAKNSTSGNGAKKSKGTKQQMVGGTEGETHSVIFVEPIMDGVVPSALGFKQLEDTIHKLQTDFRALEELASTAEMVERIKSNSTDPVSDMWHTINITKRLDAAEKGIDKITTLVQDLIKSDKVVTLGASSERNATVSSTPEEATQKFTEIETRLAELERLLAYGPSSTGEVTKTGGVENKPSIKVEPSSPGTGTVSIDTSSEITALVAEIAQLRNEVADLAARMENQDNTMSKKTIAESAGATETDKSELSGAPSGPGEQCSKMMQQIQEIEETWGPATKELLQRVQELEKDVGCLMEKSNSAPMAGVGPEGSQGLGELLNKIQTIQSDMETVNQTANRLLDDKETRETHTNALLEQIELLKTIKADKEDLEFALADKADARSVNRKVSYDQFDAACDDLARGLEDAVSKLSQQEGIWQKALDDVQQEIEGKLDKIEISPLKEFVNNKLKTLQDKLKTLSEMRRESEAAGTKKLLRDVQCLSCDKNVVMKMKEGAVYHAEPMPCTRSMKPYLTYELDQVRKQQRRLPHGRNMIQFEAAMQEEQARKNRVQKDPEVLAKSPRDHLCNRYCGGSHTVTTPQQRVMRMGHFLSQWGPEAIQLTEGVIRGTDGQFYRSRALPSSPEVCVPQDSGDQQQPEAGVASAQEPRAASIASFRNGDAKESAARSSSSVKPSSSASNQRKSTPRRLTVIKPPSDRPPSSISVPKVSEVILEEPASTEGEEGPEGEENEEEEEAADSEEQIEEGVSVAEEPGSVVEEVVSESEAQPEAETAG